MSFKAIVFAGQGAQAVGMGKDLADAYPEIKALYTRANEVLGYDITRVCFEGPIEELIKTRNCQPAIFVTSIACWRGLEKENGPVAFAGTAGLSLGEWSALHMAGVVSYDDALRILEARGRFMQEACEEKPGGMVSVIGLGLDKLKEVCAATGAEIANLNSEDQTVLSGTKAAVEEAAKAATAAGAKKTVPLTVAGAYHSSLMASAAAKLEGILGGITFNAPTISVVSNVTAQPHGGPAEIKATMLRQVTSSVQWYAGINWFKSHGVTEYLECGPGRVLSGLIKRIDKESAVRNIQDAASLKEVSAAYKV